MLTALPSLNDLNESTPVAVESAPYTEAAGIGCDVTPCGNTRGLMGMGAAALAFFRRRASGADAGSSPQPPTRNTTPAFTVPANPATPQEPSKLQILRAQFLQAGIYPHGGYSSSKPIDDWVVLRQRATGKIFFVNALDFVGSQHRITGLFPESELQQEQSSWNEPPLHGVCDVVLDEDDEILGKVGDLVAEQQTKMIARYPHLASALPVASGQSLYVAAEVCSYDGHLRQRVMQVRYDDLVLCLFSNCPQLHLYDSDNRRGGHAVIIDFTNNLQPVYTNAKAAMLGTWPALAEFESVAHAQGRPAQIYALTQDGDIVTVNVHATSESLESASQRATQPFRGLFASLSDRPALADIKGMTRRGDGIEVDAAGLTHFYPDYPTVVRAQYEQLLCEYASDPYLVQLISRLQQEAEVPVVFRGKGMILQGQQPLYILRAQSQRDQFILPAINRVPDVATSLDVTRVADDLILFDTKEDLVAHQLAHYENRSALAEILAVDAPSVSVILNPSIPIEVYRAHRRPPMLPPEILKSPDGLTENARLVLDVLRHMSRGTRPNPPVLIAPESVRRAVLLHLDKVVSIDGQHEMPLEYLVMAPG